MKTEVFEIHPQYPDLGVISRCAKIIRQGGLVVFPTETVYGVGADFNNPRAMQRLCALKQRPSNKPFSLLISQKGILANYTFSSDSAIYKAIDRFWPGPLTIVVPSKREGETIGVRMPDHPAALRLVAESGCAFAAPSANLEGQPPPRTCAEALQDLDGQVEAAIDGGAATIGRGSTVVDLTQRPPRVLREGFISQSDIEEVAARKTILFVCTGNSCRSVMAEYLMRQALAGRDDVEIISAGTGVFIHSTASSETISVLREEGINATGHVSQPMNSTLLKKADLIIVMTRSHRHQVLDRVPEVEKRVYLLREFAHGASSFIGDFDIPDPIGRSHLAYKDCMAMIKESIHKLKDLV